MMKYIHKYIGRDTEYYSWFLVNIILHPETFYETCRYQYGLTHQWHRRYHSITKIVLLLNTVLSFVFGITFIRYYFIIPYILFDVLIPSAIGVIISLIIYNLSKAYFTTGDTFTLRYSYDVHINSYCCYLLVSHVVIFILSPFLFQDSTLSMICSNLLLFVAVSYYAYITYLGYRSLLFE